MRTRAYTLALALALSAASPLLVSSSAQAQSADAMTEMARQRFQEGVQYYDAKDYEKARAAFLQAYALKKHPSVLLNLAQSELRSGHEADAAQHFEQFLRENPAVSAAEKSEAQKGFEAAKAKVGEFPVTAPSGAQVFVDGEPVGTAPLPAPVYLSPGNHKFEARKGTDSAVQDVNSVAGTSTPVSLAFGGASAVGPGPIGGPDQPPPGDGNPDTQPPGDDGGGFQVSTTGDREPFLDWALESPVAYVGGGLFALGLVGGVVFALSSSASYSDADNVRSAILKEAMKPQFKTNAPCNPSDAQYSHFSDACATWQDHVDSGDSKKGVATVSFIVAAVGAGVVAGGYFLTAEKSPAGTAKQDKGKRAPRTYASPVVTDDFKGFAFGGSF
ncbi:MAG: tol-pal system YbgF family protein [Polyangiaceae bacterium]